MRKWISAEDGDGLGPVSSGRSDYFMNGIVGLVAFCVLGACLLLGMLCFGFCFGRVTLRIMVRCWSSAKRAERAASETNSLIRMSWGAERKLEAPYPVQSCVLMSWKVNR